MEEGVDGGGLCAVVVEGECVGATEALGDAVEDEGVFAGERFLGGSGRPGDGGEEQIIAHRAEVKELALGFEEWWETLVAELDDGVTLGDSKAAEGLFAMTEEGGDNNGAHFGCLNEVGLFLLEGLARKGDFAGRIFGGAGLIAKVLSRDLYLVKEGTVE